VELTSPTTGFVHSLNVEIGDTVNVGQTLCEIRTEGDDALPEEGRSEPEPEPVETEAERGPGLGKVRNEESPEVAKAEDISEELGKHSETCSTPAKEAPSISTETTDEVTEVPLDEDLLASRDSAMDSVGGSWFSGEGSVLPSAPSSSASSSSEAVLERRQRSETSVGARSIVKTSPAVRTLAARLGVDLDDVEGTGDGGRVTKEDVHAAAGDSSVQGEMAAGMSNVDRGKQEEVTRVYLGRTRKVMWRAMGSMGDVPHFG